MRCQLCFFGTYRKHFKTRSVEILPSMLSGNELNHWKISNMTYANIIDLDKPAQSDLILRYRFWVLCCMHTVPEKTDSLCGHAS